MCGRSFHWTSWSFNMHWTFFLSMGEQLRRICRASGVSVSINPENTRDSFYRASVDFVLNVCSRFRFTSLSIFLSFLRVYLCWFLLWFSHLENHCRVPSYSTSVHIGGEDARQFIAGLADNIGLEKIRAARMVSGAVAARTRSSFLQAWVTSTLVLISKGFSTANFHLYFSIPHPWTMYTYILTKGYIQVQSFSF